MSRTKWILLVCSSALLFSACASGSAENAATVAEVQPAPPFAPLTEIREGRKDLYLIVKNLDSSYWQVIIDGARDAGEAMDCNIYYSGTYAETDWKLQEELLEDCIQRNADAVLFSPDDSVMLAAKIAEVHEHGIPVVLIDTTANTEEYDVCYMTDNLLAGQNAAAEMISQLRGRGFGETEPALVGIQVGSTASQTINERLAGFFQYWTKHAPDSWQIIQDIKCCEGNAELAVSEANALLDEYPEVDGVYGTNNSPTVGFAKVVRERERTDVTVVGFDYSEEIAALISSPDYSAATMLQRQYDMTYQGTAAALDLIAGGEITVKFVDTGVVTVNRKALDDPAVQEVLSHN